MAADLFLLRKCSQKNLISIRFYSWNPPSITVGYMQDPSQILNMDALSRDNVSWIKRPTGGRAVMHFEDLTYSCVFPNSMRLMGSTVQESNSIITDCLIKGLNQAGITCQSHDSYDQLLEVKREIKLPCFLAPNRDEIMVNGKKLVGSAQRRTTNGVLQHGSIPLTGYFRRLPLYLNISERQQETQVRLLQNKCTCIDELQQNLSEDKLAEFLMNGFVKKLSLSWIRQDWSEEELTEIKLIQQSLEYK